MRVREESEIKRRKIVITNLACTTTAKKHRLENEMWEVKDVKNFKKRKIEPKKKYPSDTELGYCSYIA
jgi:hypothetical protein